MKYKVNDLLIAQYRVALLLEKYQFGANLAAKYLDRPRGLVQSWMQLGKDHPLAEYDPKMRLVQQLLKRIRKRVTKRNLPYFLALRLLTLDLPSSYISRTLDIPHRTVISWKHGASPIEAKEFIVDRHYIDNKARRLLSRLRRENTEENLPYFLARRIADEVRSKLGPHRVGGRTIVRILQQHVRATPSLSERTVTYWIDGRRQPTDAFDQLLDEAYLATEFRNLEQVLTEEHITYNLAKELHDVYDHSTAEVSAKLDEDKERVRGWVKKDRGNPIAKCFRDQSVVDEEIGPYLCDEPASREKEETTAARPAAHHGRTTAATMAATTAAAASQRASQLPPRRSVTIDPALEREIIYHLRTFPSGVSSPKVIKSILIDQKDAGVKEIRNVLKRSDRIILKNQKWVLKDYALAQCENT